ncbi:MAG: ABC transporter permease [Bacteroidetes bacterium]|nr:ABC transporter permease [Bacteroidota bacterium]
MWKLILLELLKISRRPRTYIAFAAIWAIVALIQLALYVDGPKYMEFFLKDVADSFDIVGNPLNGYFVCFVILQTLLVHVPLLVAIVSADMISGEANLGTLRLIMSKPYSRTNILLSKFAASTIYTLILLLWIAFTGLFLSVVFFGTDGMIHAKSYEIIVLNGNDIFWRYLLAFSYAALALTTVASLGFFFSIFSQNSLGPIVTTMSVIIVMTILTTLDIPLFQRIKHFFFTSHMIAWKGFFEMQTDENGTALPGTIRNLSAILRSGVVLLGHIVGFVGASIFIFRKKDIVN